jgi:hypothetical protein
MAATIGGQSFALSASTSTELILGGQVALTGVKTGTLSTRSSDTAGTLTLTAGHGVTDGALLAIYWATGKVTHATVGTVSGTSVPFTGAAGDVLPAQTTAVTAAVGVVIDAVFTGANATGVACQCDQAAWFDWRDAGGSEWLVEVDANLAVLWASELVGATNPVTGDSIITVVAYNQSATAATAKIGVDYET